MLYIKLKYAMSLALVFLFLQSCASKPVDKAFAGKLDAVDEVKTITEYCQSCHVHRNFNPSGHLKATPSKYETEPYASAKNCRTCHSIKRNFWSDIVRNTYFPKGRIVGGQQ